MTNRVAPLNLKGTSHHLVVIISVNGSLLDTGSSSKLQYLHVKGILFSSGSAIDPH